MKYNKVKKLLGISAVVVCCGTVMFTFTGCQTKQPVAETVQMQEVQQDDLAKEGGAIANDIDLTQNEVEVQSEEQIGVFYEQCATEADSLVMVNGEQVDYTIKDYVAPNFFEYMTNLDNSYEVNEEEGYVANEYNVISDNYEITDDGKLLVRDVKMDMSIPVVKYVRVSDTEVEARYIGLAPNDSNMVSGITFVMEKNDEGAYKLTGLRGVFDEDITGLSVYEGTFNGWAMDHNGIVAYEAGDEIKISGDLTLYPHFLDNEAGKVANEDGTCVEDQIEMIDELPVLRVIHINGTKTDKDGKILETKKYALADLDAKKDIVKTKDGNTVDKDTVEKQQTEETVPEPKPKPQPAKNKESNAQPGQPKPASAVNESPQAQDTFDQGADIGERGLGSDGRGMATDGWVWVDSSTLDSTPYCGIMVE